MSWFEQHMLEPQNHTIRRYLDFSYFPKLQSSFTTNKADNDIILSGWDLYQTILGHNIMAPSSIWLYLKINKWNKTNKFSRAMVNCYKYCTQASYPPPQAFQEVTWVLKWYSSASHKHDQIVTRSHKMQHKMCKRFNKINSQKVQVFSQNLL